MLELSQEIERMKVVSNGVASFTNKEYGCTMELQLCKEQIWVYEGNVYIFARFQV